jgi:hypothetical protein
VPKVEVYEMARLCHLLSGDSNTSNSTFVRLTVSHKAPEVSAHDAVPSRSLAVVKLMKWQMSGLSCRSEVVSEVYVTVRLMCCAMSFSMVNFCMASWAGS